MPTALNEANVRHLLRRTEFVDRQSRVDELLALGSIEDAVDDILDSTQGSAGSLDSSGSSNWEKGVSISLDWLNRMAASSSPFRERMAFFWHGHLCSDNEKVRSGLRMGQQIDLYRTDGVNGSFGQLLKDMSIQVAMLRYLDNDRNFAESPNQNFARELKELFVLGVGNYEEADVEAATSAWTGHTAYWDGDSAHEFEQELHDRSVLSFLGKQINSTIIYDYAGFETIDVMLWLSATYAPGTGGSTNYAGSGGIVPVGPNQGRPSNVVAAEFISRKLWQEFGEADSGDVPPAVKTAMVDALVDNDFSIRHWVRAMLTHDDFYPETNPTVSGGLVRQPVEYMVALMVASGRTSEEVASLWLMGQTGQELLYPPNVSGWKPNGYWVNASALEARNRLAQSVIWELFDDYWTHDWSERYKNFIQLPGGKIFADEITGPSGSGAPWHTQLSNDDLVDTCLDYMDLHLPATARQRLIDFCASHGSNLSDRRDLILLILIAPEMHIN